MKTARDQLTRTRLKQYSASTRAADMDSAGVLDNIPNLATIYEEAFRDGVVHLTLQLQTLTEEACFVFLS